VIDELLSRCSAWGAACLTPSADTAGMWWSGDAVPSPGGDWRTAPDYLVLLDAHGDFMAISGSVVLAWELLAEPIEFDTLVSELTSTYETSIDDVAPVLKTMVESLKERGVVEEFN
jgi:hypothetical protein